MPVAHVHRTTEPRGEKCHMTLMETLQLFLVIIGICSLFIQLYNKK